MSEPECKSGCPSSKKAAKKAKKMSCQELLDKINELKDQDKTDGQGTKAFYNASVTTKETTPHTDQKYKNNNVAYRRT